MLNNLKRNKIVIRIYNKETINKILKDTGINFEVDIEVILIEQNIKLDCFDSITFMNITQHLMEDYKCWVILKVEEKPILEIHYVADLNNKVTYVEL